jgi:hypothetical protein
VGHGTYRGAVRVVSLDESEVPLARQQQPLLAAERNFAPVNARGALCAIVEAIWRDLTCFQVDVNQVTSLPPELGLLTNLKELNVRLQADGLQFDPISCFQVGSNQLTSLPAEIGQLAQLEALLVRNSNRLLIGS